MEVEKVKSALADLKHPEINMTLMELGMIGDIDIKNNEVSVILKIPLPGIPIQDMLTDMIRDKIKSELKVYADIKIEVMNESEKQRFMKLAQENWAL